MRFNDRREFLYDQDVFKRHDVKMALKLHHEFLVRSAGRPYTRFFEVDRNSSQVDPLWRQPVSERTQFSRVLEVPTIVKPEKFDFTLTQQGLQPKQKARFWTSNLALQLLDYFPLPGDLIYWNGYRFELIHIDFDQNSYWQQTNVWLGIVYLAEVVPTGDVRPLVNSSQPAVVELAGKSIDDVKVPLDKSRGYPAPMNAPLAPQYQGPDVPLPT